MCVAGSCRVFCVRQLKTVINIISLIIVTIIMISQELSLKHTCLRCCGGRPAMTTFRSICRCLQSRIDPTPHHSTTWTPIRIRRTRVRRPHLQPKWIGLRGDVIIIMICIIVVVLVVRWMASFQNVSQD